MSEIIKLLDSRFVTDRDVRVTRALVSLDEYSQLKQRITELEQQLKTAKADGVREFIPTIKAMEEPDYLKGRFQAELFWRGAFAAQKLAEEYANNLEGKCYGLQI